MPSGNIYDATSGQLISYGGAPGPFVGATASAAGSAGVVPAPSAGDNNKVLRGDGTWGDSAGPVIAGVENTTTSTSVYASGDYVLVMGALYEVTSAIAIGDTLAPGVNLNQNPTKVMTEITKVNQNLTCKYNASDDYFYVLLNGTWKKSLKAYVKSFAVYVNGTFGIDMSNGTPQSAVTYTTSAWTLGTDTISGTLSSNNTDKLLLSQNTFDVTNYSTIKATTNIGTVTLNVSGYSGLGYLGVRFFKTNSGVLTFGIYIASTRTYSAVNVVDNLVYNQTTSSATIIISSIVIE